MPVNLVRSAIEQTFQLEVPIKISEALAYWLSRSNPDEILRLFSSSREREKCLARCHHFDGYHIVPLNEQFGVSKTAMARRLWELNEFA